MVALYENTAHMLPPRAPGPYEIAARAWSARPAASGGDMDDAKEPGEISVMIDSSGA